MDWLLRILGGSLPVLSGRDRIRELVEMDGITDDEQQELYDLTLNIKDGNLERAKALAAQYEARGATFRYKYKNDEKPKRGE